MQFDDFLKVLDLLQNPVAYKEKAAELAAKLNEVQEHEQKIQDAIATLNLGNDILKTQAKAVQLNEQAQATLEKAQAKAAEIIAGAQVAFDKKFAELQAKEVVADQAIANYNTIKSQQTSRENELHFAEKEIAKVQAQLVASQQALSEKQLEVDARLDKLRQVMG